MTDIIDARRLARSLAMALVTGAALIGAAQAASPDPALRAQLETLAGKRVFFAHQSVGGNIVEGLQAIAQQNGVALQIRDVGRDNVVPNQTFGHVFVGENGKPLVKIQEYGARLAQQSTLPDVAAFKLCFLDFRADTDPKAVFARYQSEVNTLHTRYPGLKLVHVTTPLTTIESGPKAWAKRLLGKKPWGLIENQKREQYNELLRAAYGGREPLFDLARVESTAPDGSRTLTQSDGVQTPALTASYASDGSHLNAEGEQLAARAFVGVLAQTLAPRAAP
jgi:hypothetical protein